MNILKYYIRLALLIGAFLGFFGQSVAIAMSPACAMFVEQVNNSQAKTSNPIAQNSMDCCPEMAGGQHDSKQSNGKPPNCLAMMGGTVSLALAHVLAVPPGITIKPITAVWPIPRLLTGRSTAPDAPPPTL